MSSMTAEEIRQALYDNSALPHGAARNAQAEVLTAAAETCGDPELFRLALVSQIDAYEYSAERTRMVVPFARLLQEYDRDPGAFDSNDTYALFWRFKWVSGRIVESPEIPIGSVTRWLDDMERRYRIAGYSERAVRQAEFYLAHAIGDDERAERAVERWQAAERDGMSDCHACETHTQGWFWANKGLDAKAIDIWEPVLAGRQVCREEPHRVLARSLLPLLRLGRADEARAHHLRGYRMARGKESLLRSIGEHIEFCALTGNESRGLEILSEHTGYLGPLADVDAQMEFYGGILVLLRRLTRLGHGAAPSVPYDGSPRTVDELYGILHADALAIAHRFDVRNGTTRVSDELLERIDRAPLAEVLPLGVRSAALPGSAPAVPGSAVPMSAGSAAVGTAAVGPGDLGPVTAAPAAGFVFAELVERARQARDQGHPSADGLWAEVAVRADSEPDAGADPLVAADVADHRALAAARLGSEDAPGLLTAVRDGYRALGQDERAALAELRLASVAAQSGAAAEEIRKLLAVALRAAEALDTAEPLRARRIALAELSTIRVESYLRSVEAAGDGHPHEHDHVHDHGSGGEHGHTELVAGLTGFAAAYQDELPDLAAEAEEMLGRLALSQGDPERALPLLASAAARAIAAGLSWQAVDPLVLQAGVLMSLDRPEDALEAARSGLEHAAEVTDAETQGLVRLTLADILLRRPDGAVEAAELALTGAHWFDQAGLAADGGAQARLTLARAYGQVGRTAEAAEVLQSSLPDLLEHGEGQAVAARELLGGLLGQLREPRAAAEQFLLAAEVAKGWENPRAQASLAQAAADQLSEAQLVPEAVAAYERALELHRLTGAAPGSEVRILRSLAWLALREDVSEAAVGTARARMDEAAEVLETALLARPGDPELQSELAQTWHQLAQVLDRWVTQAEEPGREDANAEGDADGHQEDSGASAAPGLLTGTQITALRQEEILLWDRAADIYAELGPEYLKDRFQCLNNAAWTEQELGRPAAGAARISALADEVRELPEGTAPEWLLSSAERVLRALTD
ncbi:tetratricopeptide repeat protein [Streptomyces xanthophaeus]|uniref:tetratricopeptide repeat protein n=1 Tax=Streptomyces xanthophaeus TaxID=67385 RepID=UPI0036BE0446